MRDGVVEEGLLLVGADSVDGAESKAEKTAGLGVPGELVRDLLGRFNSLVLDSEATDGNGVKIDVAAAAALVTVGDVPSSTGDLLGGGTLGDIVQGLATDFRGISLRAEHPQVTGTSVEVEVQSLGRSSDLDGGDVGNVVLLGGGDSRASVTTNTASRALYGVDQVLGYGLAILAVSLGESKSAIGLVGWVGNDFGREATRRGRDSAGKVAREEERNDECSDGLHCACQVE